MDYQQTIDFLYGNLPMFQRTGPRGYKIDLSTTLEIDAYFDFPHRAYKTIHIAGTNGKGSVANALAAVLQAAGYKTGLYTSPHLLDFRERIRVDGSMIPENDVVRFISENMGLIEKLHPSFFELTTAMAFEYFKKQSVDVAVIETGLGGRLDSTNVINPVVSVITNIGLDHTDLLGNTIEQIAIEKAGIIKNNVPLVVGEWTTKTAGIFEDAANTKNAAIFFADKNLSVVDAFFTDSDKQVLSISKDSQVVFPNLEIDLMGFYQQKNILTVLQTIEILIQNGFLLEKEDIYTALANICASTGFAGRWQVLANNPLIVCDTGHNEHGLALVLNQLKQIKFRNLHIIIGFVEDKKIDGILTMLPKDAKYYITQASVPRALNCNVLHTRCSEVGLVGNAYPDINSAYHEAITNANENDMIFVGGSTFIVADFLKLFNSKTIV
ncbi:MAG: bifunctional folylpolyglutamate synthase/dihydrofolate synthase [Paludibacteraceae bacterium]|nr:bifunctional folylpolyglutamate synthase/dihydrofolate synthase [Paludibacteraceae bacterium]